MIVNIKRINRRSSNQTCDKPLLIDKPRDNNKLERIFQEIFNSKRRIINDKETNFSMIFAQFTRLLNFAFESQFQFLTNAFQAYQMWTSLVFFLIYK